MYKITKNGSLALGSITMLFIAASYGHQADSFPLNEPAQVVKADSVPNIVFILADDLGWNALSCYGNNYYETPNLDRLASEGMRFTNAYACTVCSPSRAEIMTGKYAARLHVTDYISGDRVDSTRILNIPKWTRYLPLEETTIAEELKGMGYKTALFGKWHLSKKKYPPLSLPFDPDKQGFDETRLTLKPDKNYPLQAWQIPENDAHNTRHITDWGLKFLEENKDRRFFMFLSYDAVHDPLMEKKALVDKYRKKADAGDSSQNPVLAAVLKSLDENIGRVLARIDELHLRENTLVVFYSDNGGLAKAAAQVPLRGGKATLYEGGIRVPLIVRWPGIITPSATCDSIVGSIDLFPTFSEVGGAEINGSDGLSLLPLLTANGKWSRDAYYWHYPHYHSGWPPSNFTRPQGAIRMGNYKLIEYFEKTLTKSGNGFELYDLRKDIGEKENLADRMPDMVSVLSSKLENWRKRVGAQMPVLK